MVDRDPGVLGKGKMLTHAPGVYDPHADRRVLRRVDRVRLTRAEALP